MATAAFKALVDRKSANMTAWCEKCGIEFSRALAPKLNGRPACRDCWLAA